MTVWHECGDYTNERSVQLLILPAYLEEFVRNGLTARVRLF